MPKYHVLYEGTFEFTETEAQVAAQVPLVPFDRYSERESLPIVTPLEPEPERPPLSWQSGNTLYNSRTGNAVYVLCGAHWRGVGSGRALNDSEIAQIWASGRYTQKKSRL